MPYGALHQYGRHVVKVLPDHPRDLDVPLHEQDAELRSVSTFAQIAADTDAQLRHAVDRARFAGASWSQIGHYLGISKQAAAQRFGTP